MQPRVRGGVVAQRGQGVIVAGVEAQHVGAVVKGHREGAFQVGVQRLDLRGQPRLGLALGPEQLLAELRQARALAFLPDDEVAAQLRLPALELAPHVAVRQPQRLRSGRDGAVGLHRVEQVHQRVADAAVAALGLQGVGQFDLLHGVQYPASSGTPRQPMQGPT